MVTSELPAIAPLEKIRIPPEPDRPASATQRRVINVTGRGNAVAFIIDEAASIDEVAGELETQLSAQGALFSAGGVTVNTGARILNPGEKDAIRRIFAQNSGLQVSRFISTAGDYAPEPPSPPLRPAPSSRRGAPAPPPTHPFADLTRNQQRNRAQALLIRSTFRSGESVNHRGDVIVLGDMNPGSEILADGDIIVMGAIKGLPHAGASGDDKAAIIALEINAPRIRIGMSEADAPAQNAKNPKRRNNPGHLTIAYARRGSIHISPFAGRFARYTKGVPYDR